MDPLPKQLNLIRFNVGLRQERRAVGNATLEPMVKTVYKKVCRRSVCIEVIHELEQLWSEKTSPLAPVEIWVPSAWLNSSFIQEYDGHGIGYAPRME
jgi:hypothetical protein